MAQPAASVALPAPAEVLARLGAVAKPPLKAQVFISHTGQDADACTFAASILAPALEAAGLYVFIDHFGLQPGDAWRPELLDAAANSAAVIGVLSRTYARRFWCMLELDAALRSHTPAAVAAAAAAGAGAETGAAVGSSASSAGAPCPGPVVIPVYYDTAAEVTAGVEVTAPSGGGSIVIAPLAEYWAEHHWAARAASAFEAQWVDPAQWAANVGALPGERQALRRASYAALKDGERRLADAVVRAALRHVRPAFGTNQPMFGFDAQVGVMYDAEGYQRGLGESSGVEVERPLAVTMLGWILGAALRRQVALSSGRQ
jgi:hypothetical protein